jgi:hypothetical protein
MKRISLPLTFDKKDDAVTFIKVRSVNYFQFENYCLLGFEVVQTVKKPQCF